MITLEEYKSHLLNQYLYPIDRGPERLEKRKKALAKNYSDEYLSRIISDTYEFAEAILNSDFSGNMECEFNVSDIVSRVIDLNVEGGSCADILYLNHLGKIVSDYILRLIFGYNLIIVSGCEGLENEGKKYYRRYLQIAGLPRDLSKIRKSLLGQAKKLEGLII